MRKRIQRKPKRYAPERVSHRQTTRSISIQEAVTILGGITGLIVAILWLAGRFYAAGYFSAMNIPAFQISFSVWEYAELAWSRLLFYFLSKLYPPLIIVASVAFTSFLSILALQRIFPNLKLIELLERIALQAENLPGSFRSLFFFVLIMYFIFILLDVFIEINKSGQHEGRLAVLMSSYGVEVYSKDYMPLGTPKMMPNTTPVLMEYSGLRLLTFNSGKYYLFRDVDPVTCRPSQVFIISDSPDVHLAVSPIAPVDVPCAGTAVDAPGTSP